jgi:predicted nucleic acid-binding protein
LVEDQKKLKLELFEKNCKIKSNNNIFYGEFAGINEEISAKAMFYIERNFLSHSLQLADALVASTALVNGLPIITGNDKHYKIIKEIELLKFRP